MEWLDHAASDLPMELLSDEQVLALRNLQMSDEQQDELSTLLAGQREHQLEARQQAHLDDLLATYRSGMKRKAQALKVAMERGLQPSLGKAR